VQWYYLTDSRKLTAYMPYMPGAEPYFHRGNAVGCLCLHGFMASPAEVRWLGVHLAQQGMTVYTPRLAGHGTDYTDMARMQWQDWYHAALDGYHILRQQCERVFVAGLSMGGMLALLLGASVPVDGLAVLAAPVIFHSRQMANAHWLKYLGAYTKQPDRSNLPQLIREEQARRGELVLGRVRYDDWSTHAVGQLYALSLAVRTQLAQVTAPLLLVYSEADQTVSIENRAIVAREVGSKTIEQHTLHTSEHILTQHVERETVFALVADFIARQA
jgi:carboxylesterase